MSEMTDSVSVPSLTLGWRMQMALAQSGQSRAAIAAALGVDASTVGRWMNDRGAPPKKAYITQWAWLTRVPVEWLESGETPSFSDPAGQRAQGLNGGRISRGSDLAAGMGAAAAHRKSTRRRLVAAGQQHATAA